MALAHGVHMNPFSSEYSARLRGVMSPHSSHLMDDDMAPLGRAAHCIRLWGAGAGTDGTGIDA